MAKLIRPSTSKEVAAVYRVVFIFLCKLFLDEGNDGLKKYVVSTFKNLLKCYLQKRTA